jgi:hypothetical protein
MAVINILSFGGNQDRELAKGINERVGVKIADKAVKALERDLPGRKFEGDQLLSIGSARAGGCRRVTAGAWLRHSVGTRR